MKTAKPAPPCVFVLFGATGDLTARLVFPAIYNLAVGGLLPKEFSIVGIARKEANDDAFRKHLRESLDKYAGRKVDDKVATDLLSRVTIVNATIKDAGSFSALRDTLEKIDAEHKTGGNRIFYLAIPPSGFAPTVRALGEAGLTKETGESFVRVIIEKPFGHDLESAMKLNADLLRDLTEEQIYRIDHYLGKETVQNIMMLRFSNGLFEPIWNRMHIDHVQITVAETVTVGERGAFLRGNRRAARHGAEPSLPAALVDRDGAAGATECRQRTIGESTRARCDPVAVAAGSARCVCARAVRVRPHQWEAGRRLPAGRRGCGRQHDRDLLRIASAARYVALGWCSLLSAHRQGARSPSHRSCREIP